MPNAVRINDLALHGGQVTGAGVPTVKIEGQVAAVMTDLHQCVIVPPAHPPSPSPFTVGSSKVFIGKMPALRTGDACVCGASVAIGAVSVIIA